jgi:hypothetical protein
MQGLTMASTTYLGEFDVDLEKTECAGFGPSDWAMRFVGKYGQIDGSHHKTWVLDQVARILKGTPVLVKEARWTDHKPELRIETGEPSAEYLAWVNDMRGKVDEDGEPEYWYAEGIAP